jgi:hypothetical protein
MSNDKPFPIQRWKSIPWSAAEKAYETYARLFGTDQSLERLAERGGFGLQEFACLYLGHNPTKHGYTDDLDKLKGPECVARVALELEADEGDIFKGLRAAKEAVDRIYANESPEMKRLRQFLERAHPEGVDLLYHPDDESVARETKELIEREFRLPIRALHSHRALEKGQLVFMDIAEIEKPFRLPTGGLMPGQ